MKVKTAVRGWVAAVVASAVGLTSCGQVVNGSMQKISVMGIPAGASIQSSDGRTCTLPCTMELARKQEQAILISKAGYKPATVMFRQETEGGLVAVDVILMIIFFPIGLSALASLNGGWWRLTPGAVTVTLEPEPYPAAPYYPPQPYQYAPPASYYQPPPVAPAPSPPQDYRAPAPQPVPVPRSEPPISPATPPRPSDWYDSRPRPVRPQSLRIEITTDKNRIALRELPGDKVAP